MSDVSDFVSRLSVGFSGNTAGVMSTVGNGTVVFVGGPNVTLSQDGRTVTISAPPPSAGAAISAGASSQSTGTIVFSNSNGLAFSLNAGTLTGSYTVPTVPPETPFGISAGTQSVSTGTLVFSNSNGISFGMSGSSRVTASYTVPTVPAQFTGGFSTQGNTLGNTGMVTGQVLLVGGPNITLSGSTNAGSITLTVSGGAGAAGNTGFISAGANTASLGTVVFSNSNNVSFGVNGQTITATATVNVPPETPFGVSAGTQSVSTGTLVFSNSNGISFGMSGSSRITASYTVPTETPFGVSAGTQSVSTGTLVFSNANNVTFGMSGSSRVTASASFPSETPFGVSAGTQSVSTGTLVFSNSNNVTFGMSGSSRVTASASFPAQTALTKSIWVAWGDQGQPFAPQTHNVDRPQFAGVSVRDHVTATQCRVLLTVDVSTSSNSSHAGAISGSWVLYSRNGSTLSSITSAAASASWSNTSNNSISIVEGLRVLSFAANVNITPGEYYFGWLLRTATTNANWFTASFFNGFVANSGVQGLFGAVVNSTNQFPIGVGFLSTTTAGTMASVALSDLRMSGSVLRMPLFYFGNFTV